ncbi:MAG: hemerythrin domain-containing protein [Alphaproteobacteria bacterium]
MQKFVWLETFELGIPQIDDEHKQMLSIMQRVQDTANAEQFDECMTLLDDLISVSEAHFTREEELLEKLRYPGVAEHREYHSALLARAEAVKEICKGMRSRANFKGCCEEMFGFLVDDVVAGDLTLKSFLQEKGAIKRG